MNALAPLMAAQEPLQAKVAYDGVRVTGVCIPPSLEDLAYNGPTHFVNGNPDYVGRRTEELREHGVTTALALNVTKSTTRILNPELLTTSVLLSYGIELRANPSEEADLLPMDPAANTTFYMRTGGCGALIMIADGVCLVGHLSRWNCFDHELINRNIKSRDHQGLIHAGVAYFDQLGIDRSKIQVYLFFPISAESFSHSANTKDRSARRFALKFRKHIYSLGYGERVLTRKKGNFSFEKYVSETCKKLGLRPSKCVCTLPNEGEFAVTRHSDPRLANSRNTVLITISYTPKRARKG
ncbi:MAG: hypothetical protein AB203_04455 [Parcubacteria bacterium C7867-008]|nr:MAG: hypothetical protein AB203_04455 [Parcubacteria bacterium C7867-008]